MEFDKAFVACIKALLEFLNLNKFLSQDLVPAKIKIICFWFQMAKSD